MSGESQPGPGPQQPGKELDIFRPFDEPNELRHSKELVPLDGHSKEVVVPEDHSKELVPLDGHSKEVVVPEDHSKELVPLDGHSKEVVVPEDHSKELVPLEKEGRITAVIGGVTERAERQSVLVSAEKKFDAGSAEKGGRVRRFIRNIIRHDIGREFTLLRNRKQAEKAIQETHRLYGMTEEQWGDLSAAHIQRVLDDREVGEMMDEKAGERQQLLESQKGGKEVRGVINGLVAEYVKDYKGKYDTPEGKASMQEEMRRRMAELARGNPDVQALIGEGEAYMSNIVDIAEAVRQRVSHEQGIDNVLAKVDIVAARLDPGARTELKKTKPQKAFDWIADHSWGVGNGTNIALAASIAYGVGSAFVKTGANWGSRLITGGAVAFGGAFIGGLQEKYRLRQERAQVQREAELGYKVDDGSKRREMLVRSMNEMKNATDITELLKGFTDKEGKFEVTSENFGTLLTATAEASARRDLSSAEKRAFLSFSGETEAQNAEERRQLFLQTVHARKALREYYEAQNLSGDSKKYGKNFDEFYEGTKSGVEASMLKEALAADKQFGRDSNKAALIKGGIILGTGLVMGQFTREIIGGFSDNVQNTFEAFRGQNSNAETATGLAMLAHAWNLAPHPTTPNIGAPNLLDHALPKGGNFKLDDRLSFTENKDGTMNLKGPNGLELDNLQRNADGTLTKASWLRVHNAGLEGSETARGIPGGSVPKEITADRYARKFGTRVDRSWWDHDTSKIYEGNERRLQLFKRKDGSFVYSIRGMIAGDSTHRGEVSNFPDGHFKMAFSLTQESQAKPIMVDIKNGQAVIKPGDPLYGLFNEKNGEPHFKGRFAEAVEMMKDRDHDGIQNVRALATDSGPGSVRNLTVEVSGDKTVNDMTIFMKKPEVVTPEGAVPGPDIPFIYPAYRTGLRTGRRAGEDKPSEGKDTGPNEGSGVDKDKSNTSGAGGGETALQDKKPENGSDTVSEAERDAQAANKDAMDEFSKNGESEAFKEKAEQAARRQAVADKAREEERLARQKANTDAKEGPDEKKGNANRPKISLEEQRAKLHESPVWKNASPEEQQNMDDELDNRWVIQGLGVNKETNEGSAKPGNTLDAARAKLHESPAWKNASPEEQQNMDDDLGRKWKAYASSVAEASEKPTESDGTEEGAKVEDKTSGPAPEGVAPQGGESQSRRLKRGQEIRDAARDWRRRRRQNRPDEGSRQMGDGRESERLVNGGELETDPRYIEIFNQYLQARQEHRRIREEIRGLNPSEVTDEKRNRELELALQEKQLYDEVEAVRDRIREERLGQAA